MSILDILDTLDYDPCLDITNTLLEFDETNIWTDYYVDSPIVSHLDQTRQNTPNFTSYNLFCLNSYLSYWVNENWSDKIDISFVLKNRLDYGNKKYISVVPMAKGEKMYLNTEQIVELQNIIDKASEVDKTFVRLIDSNSYYDSEIKKRIPSNWIKSIFPTIEIEIIYQPFINNNIMYVNLQPLTSALVDDENDPIPTINYINAYTQILENIYEQIRTMYTYAFVMNPSYEIILNWNLSNITGNLYVPKWNDNRITRAYTDLHSFLQTRLNKDTIIKYIIKNNLVTNHYLSKYLDQLYPTHQYKLGDGYLYIDVNNLTTAQSIADLIELVSVDSSGSAIPRYFTNLNEINNYILNVRSKYTEDEVSIALYEYDDYERPFSLSLLLPTNSNLNSDNVSYNLFVDYEEYHLSKYYDSTNILNMDDIKQKYNMKKTISNQSDNKNILPIKMLSQNVLKKEDDILTNILKSNNNDPIFVEYNNNNNNLDKALL